MAGTPAGLPPGLGMIPGAHGMPGSGTVPGIAVRGFGAGRMRISYRVFLVGAIPIAVAAAIALAALLLLNEAERARSGAVLAGSIYRSLTAAIAARDDYVVGKPPEREGNGGRFTESANHALADLDGLDRVLGNPAYIAAANSLRETLRSYVARMDQLMQATVHNDTLVFEMSTRATSLISLAEQARKRQQESNATLVTTLAESDRKLRGVRDFLDRGQELTAAIAAVELQKGTIAALIEGTPERDEADSRFTFALTRVRNASTDLGEALRASGRGDAALELGVLASAYLGEPMPAARPAEPTAGSVSTPAATPAASAGPSPVEAIQAGQRLAEWTDRLIKVNSTASRALHDELAQLLTYSVEANETEQATQNIAITALKLSSRAHDALSSREIPAAESILREGKALGAAVAALPISPLIQTEMIDAVAQWSEGLSTTIAGLRRQSQILADMDLAAQRMINGAGNLNSLLQENADTIGGMIREILILGAAAGLLLGGVTGLYVARSITRPLRRLQLGMMQLAANSHAGPLADTQRRDELGDMARATNIFVTEIRRREQALQRAKDRADAALSELQQTQSDLIQAEKLASLGQLVAGVAHEINTPLGIALTTATLIGDEVKAFGEAAASGRLQRSVFQRFIERMGEGSGLLYANLTRSANLVQSFKQVAADQASGERRRFDMKVWLDDLLTSLTPVLRKSGHEVVIHCRPGLDVDTYPGALGQVITNFVTNAIAHGYPDGQAGRLSITVSEPMPLALRIVFADDGQGIPPENIGKVFDPFFTTGRSTGSTGLGLHIVYNLVTSLLQGRLEIESAPRRGTQFTVDLPKVVHDEAESQTLTRSGVRYAGARA